MIYFNMAIYHEDTYAMDLAGKDNRSWLSECISVWFLMFICVFRAVYSARKCAALYTLILYVHSCIHVYTSMCALL